MPNTTPTPQQKLKRLLWLAFQASTPMGMGFLHAKQAEMQDEESLYTDAIHRDPNVINTDYLCGRMMKTTFSVDAEGKLEVQPNVPRSDYQSWARKYATGDAMIAAVEESFK